MKSTAIPLPKDAIKESLELDPSSKTWLRWKARPRHHFKNDHGMNIWNSQNAGKEAGTKLSTRPDLWYWQIAIHARFYRAHRIVYFLSTGVDPIGFHIDHIDNNGTNNNPSNLRLATNSQNLMNRGKTRKNTSGKKGVTWNKKRKKWQVKICAKGIRASIGFFDDINQAAAAYEEAAKKRHGEFAWSESKATGP